MSKPPPCPPALLLSGLSILDRRMLRALGNRPRRIPLGPLADFRRLSLHNLVRRGGCVVYLDWDSGRAFAEITDAGRKALAEWSAEDRARLAPHGATVPGT